MTFIVRQITTTAAGREITRSKPFPTDEIGVGRSTENAIHLPDLAVNPNHAVIRRRADRHPGSADGDAGPDVGDDSGEFLLRNRYEAERWRGYSCG